MPVKCNEQNRAPECADLYIFRLVNGQPGRPMGDLYIFRLVNGQPGRPMEVADFKTDVLEGATRESFGYSVRLIETSLRYGWSSHLHTTKLHYSFTSE